MPYNSTVFDQIHHTFEISFFPYRKYDRHGIGFKHIFHLLAYLKEVRTLAVHFVDKSHTRHFIVVRKAPVSFGLRFYPIYSRKEEHQTIQYTKRAVYLYGKVHVAWGIDNVEVIFLSIGCRFSIFCREVPLTSGSSRLDSDPAFCFLFHPVHSRSTIVYFPYFVRFTCIEKDTLSGSSFTRINVSGNTNVSCIF